MGIYYDFYVQQQTADGWIVPVGFKNDLDGSDEELGYFVWFKHSPIFFDESAMLPLHRTRPPEIETTSLYQQRSWGFDDSSYYGWIGLEEMLMDDWAVTYLYVSTHVPEPMAYLFMDGAQLFPEKALLERGSTDKDISAYLRSASRHIIDEPIKRRTYARDYRGWVEVSWKVSVEDVLGEWRVAEFKKLRRFGSDSEMRIICTRG